MTYNTTHIDECEQYYTDEEKRVTRERQQLKKAMQQLVLGHDDSAERNEIATNGYKYKLFPTLTPKNPNNSVSKLVKDANILLQALMESSGRNGCQLEGYAVLEEQKFRCGFLVPHIHLMLRSPKKGINSMKDKNLINKIYTLACDGNQPLFSPQGIDIQRVYNKSGLLEYITKTADKKSRNRDFITPLNDDGLLDINLILMGIKQ